MEMKKFFSVNSIRSEFFWLGFAALLLSFGWLLPNHSLPWTTFHSDAWVASVISCVGIFILLKTRSYANIYAANALSGLMILIPVIQYFYGMLPFMGQAFMGLIYMSGFVLCQFIGQQGQRWNSVCMGNFLFSAVGIAAIVSVGLQLYQWVGLTRESGMMDIWVLALGGGRPYANLGQPNQLATLLLWGFLACFWGLWQGYLSKIGTLFIASFILIGLALTQSRTGMLSLCVLIAAFCFWTPLKKNLGFGFFAVGLGGFYFLTMWSIGPLSRLMLLDESNSVLTTSSVYYRLFAWQMLVDAVAQKPWQGYGWNGVMSAHLVMGEKHQNVGQLFAQSHNIFLDFFVWTGIPVGIVFCLLLICWFVVAARRVVSLPGSLYFLMLAIVGIHSLLEFPLHYAYFLFPVGIVVGILNESLKIYCIGRFNVVSYRVLCFSYAMIVVSFCLLVRDYFRIEQASIEIRFQDAHVKLDKPASVPDIMLLTHVRAQLEFFLIEPYSGASEDELQKARNLTYVLPSYFNIMKLITFLALNDKLDEVAWWMKKVPYVIDESSRLSVPNYWSGIQSRYPSLQGVNWVNSGY